MTFVLSPILIDRQYLSKSQLQKSEQKSDHIWLYTDDRKTLLSDRPDSITVYNFEADPEYQLHYDSIVKLDTPVILGSGMQHKTSKMKQGLPPPQPDERYEGGRSSGNWTEK